MKNITEKELQKKISSPYCMGWQIKQADGSVTKDLKEARECSYLSIQNKVHTHRFWFNGQNWIALTEQELEMFIQIGKKLGKIA